MNAQLLVPTNKEYANQTRGMSVAPMKTCCRHRWTPCPRILTPHLIHFGDQDSIGPFHSIQTSSNRTNTLTCTIDPTMVSTILYIRVEINNPTHPNKNPFTDQHSKPTFGPSRIISTPTSMKQWQPHLHRSPRKQQVPLVSDCCISQCLLRTLNKVTTIHVDPCDQVDVTSISESHVTRAHEREREKGMKKLCALVLFYERTSMRPLRAREIYEGKEHE